ncbi:MAG: hypothetical protein SGI92_05955 [Bryobacteraceae bacterium]|nr:hypothetical protein [Bryobacteraceae bacterium]
MHDTLFFAALATAFEQFDDGGDHLFARQTGEAEVGFHAIANGGEGFAEGEHAAELGLVSLMAVGRVVAILLAAFRVAADGLEVALRVATNPDAGPGWWDDERADALQGWLVTHGAPVGRRARCHGRSGVRRLWRR